MSIRSRIFLSYVGLVALFLAFLSAYVYLTVLRGTIDRDLTRLYEVKSSWGDMLVSMNSIVDNWDNGRSFSNFVERLNQFQDGLDYLHTDGIRRFYYPPLLKKHVRSLYRIWLMAQGNIRQIIVGIDSSDFQRVVQQVTREPGLQRLNDLWVKLFYQGTGRQRVDAYAIRQVLDAIGFFPIYSSTMNRQFNIILRETTGVRDSVIRIQVALAFSFFALFLAGYFTFSYLFARSLSRPIVDVSVKLNEFIGQSIEPTSVVHRNEIELLDHSVTTLVEHYTYLSQLARTLAEGDIESEAGKIPKGGVVGNALSELANYLRKLAEVSAWIRDGNYGAELELRSEKDVLGQTFNIMSREIHEKITTLSRVFEAIEEGLLVVDPDGTVIESNSRLLRLLEIRSLQDLSKRGGLSAFVDDFELFRRKMLRPNDGGRFTAAIISSRGVRLPVRVTARRLEPAPGQPDHIMLFISNESWKVRMKRERARLKSQAVVAELRALRAQINPHFLFNTLNTIAQLIETTPDQAVRTIEKLAGLFRYALATTNRDTVPVAEELKHIRDFLEIEQTRFEGNLSVAYEIDESVEAVSVPPMLLQPIVENSLRHGRNDDGKVQIVICAEWRGEQVVFRVADQGTAGDGRGFYDSTGIGLKNVNNRLRSHYGTSLRIEPNEPTGTVVSIAIPAGVHGSENAYRG